MSAGVVGTADGVITKFDVATAGTGVAMVRFLCKTTRREAVTGFYVDSSNVLHGFLRTAD
jgi:hypothetical protein